MPFLILIILALLSVPAFAAEESQTQTFGAGGLVPVQSTVASLHAPAINLTMDKSELIRLDQDAASIILGNPLHANVLMDTPRLLVVVPKAPGATHFTVLNNDGEVIYERNVIVASPKQDYVRVRRGSCGEGTEGCQKNQVYYCPGMCHEIMMTPAEGEESSTASVQEDAADIANAQPMNEPQQGNMEQ